MLARPRFNRVILARQSMDFRFCRLKVFMWVMALIVAPCLTLPSSAAPSLTPSTQPVFSDFDGDNKLDQAELFSQGVQKRIHVTLGKFAWKSLSFDSGVPDRGRLLSTDVDSDGDTDLVWISQSEPYRFMLWVGDGRGNFSVFTGHEDHLLSVLRALTEPQLVRDVEEQDDTCVLQFTSMCALQPNCYVFTFPCAASKAIPPHDSAICAACLSVIRKRGPPLSIWGLSRLS